VSTPDLLPRLWTGEAVLEHALEVAGIPVTGPIREEIRKRGRSGGLRDTLAALPLAVRDPVRARLEARHQEAHGQLDRLAGRDVSDLTARRAKNRLRRVRALMAFLNRTDHVHDGVPCRAEREALINPILAELEKLTRRPQSRRERKPIIPTKETPMDYHRPGQVVEERPEDTARREQAEAARVANGHVPAGIPEVLYPFLARFDMLFRTPSAQPHAMLVHEASRLARAVLNSPPREQVDILTKIFFRLGMRSAR
jgi:hypothetical protein